MKIVVTYVYPLNGSGTYLEMAIRFLTSYHEYAAGVPHELLVVCNGSPATEETRFLFDSVPGVRFLENDNSGYDCGAYQQAARENPCDLMVFFGVSSYLRGSNWLGRMVESWTRHGPGLYGVMGNRGDDRFNVHPHIRSTGFWMAPALLNEYPLKVTNPGLRYPFEHGPNCLTTFIRRKGLKPWVVAWTGEYRWEQWDSFPGGFHRGGQENMIAGDRLTCPPFYPVA